MAVQDGLRKYDKYRYRSIPDQSDIGCISFLKLAGHDLAQEEPEGDEAEQPHDEDEVYLVLDGRARMRLGDEERAVGPGSLLYVSAATEHSFFEIEEDMTLLVMFATGQRQRG